MSAATRDWLAETKLSPSKLEREEKLLRTAVHNPVLQQANRSGTASFNRNAGCKSLENDRSRAAGLGTRVFNTLASEAEVRYGYHAVDFNQNWQTGNKRIGEDIGTHIQFTTAISGLGCKGRHWEMRTLVKRSRSSQVTRRQGYTAVEATRPFTWQYGAS